jgi:hypothetical protein
LFEHASFELGRLVISLIISSKSGRNEGEHSQLYYCLHDELLRMNGAAKCWRLLL